MAHCSCCMMCWILFKVPAALDRYSQAGLGHIPDEEVHSRLHQIGGLLLLGSEGIADAAKDAQHDQLGNCHWQRPLLLAPALSGCLQIATAKRALLHWLDSQPQQRTVGGRCSLISRESADACAAAPRPDCPT